MLRCMFIFKAAFWGFLVVMLLPGSEKEKREFYGTADRTVEDLRTFCVRNPDLCEKSRSAFDTVWNKARYGAEMLEDLMQKYVMRSSPAGEEEGLRTGAEAGAAPRKNQSTLTAEDYKPQWRGPGGR